MTHPRPWTIRAGTEQDLDGVVTCHLASFPGFFLSFLGPRFLKEFYRGLIDAPSGALLVAQSNHAVAGFVGGATDEAAFFQWLLSKRWPSFVREATFTAARHPSTIPRLWRARHRSSDSASDSTQATLLTLGVAPPFRRLGLGDLLVREFGDEVGSRGASEFSLTTDAEDNTDTHAFYQSLGMRPVATRTTPEGRRMTEYIYHLPHETGTE